MQKNPEVKIQIFAKHSFLPHWSVIRSDYAWAQISCEIAETCFAKVSILFKNMMKNALKIPKCKFLCIFILSEKLPCQKNCLFGYGIFWRLKGHVGDPKLNIYFHCLLMQKNPKVNLKYPMFSRNFSLNANTQFTNSSTDSQNLRLSTCHGQIHNRRGWQALLEKYYGNMVPRMNPGLQTKTE